MRGRVARGSAGRRPSPPKSAYSVGVTETTIRPATEADLPIVLDFVRDLAAYVNEPDAPVATVDLFAAAMFPATGTPSAYAHVAEVHGEIVAAAIWYQTFSTWEGRSGLWLDDLFVTEEYRRRGVGRELMHALAQVCVERGFARLEWSVLDWNESAIGFYKAFGGEAQEDTTIHRLTGDALVDAASEVRQLA